MLFAGDQGDHFNIRSQAVVRQRHAEFVLEIRKYPQTADNHLGIDLLDRSPRSGRCNRSREFWVASLKVCSDQARRCSGENNQIFQRPVIHSDKDLVKKPGSTHSDIDVAIMDRVKCSGKNARTMILTDISSPFTPKSAQCFG